MSVFIGMKYWAIAGESETTGLISSVIVQDAEPEPPAGQVAIDIGEEPGKNIIHNAEVSGPYEYYWDFVAEEVTEQLKPGSSVSDNKAAKLRLFTAGFNTWFSDLYCIDVIQAAMVAQSLGTGTAEEITARETFLAWVNDAYGYAAGIKIAIKAVEFQYELDAITWDFTDLESANPGYTLP